MPELGTLHRVVVQAKSLMQTNIRPVLSSSSHGGPSHTSEAGLRNSEAQMWRAKARTYIPYCTTAYLTCTIRPVQYTRLKNILASYQIHSKFPTYYLQKPASTRMRRQLHVGSTYRIPKTERAVNLAQLANCFCKSPMDNTPLQLAYLHLTTCSSTLDCEVNPGTVHTVCAAPRH